ncbi:hypothetical protein ERC79_17395 [Rhodococcus sp. ABRD24]|uniref:hypothetical protein n=1 Tax=Rhodococcus sp. ABRD24 TaxID=2507582 RepID=UPI00103C8C05|nr:hypothetical protein [Rhodococcus sp. ABRD24]QBJ97517.1 hypothetical protein ERC79_17395 [Rhodococcus sp. ABRD24]
MDRLTVVDEIFLRRHHGYGLPIVMQGLLRAADVVDAAVLESVHAALTRGALARRVVRPRVPGARPRWEPSADAHPLRMDMDPIAPGDVVRWADAQAHTDVDPERGPGWALSAVPVVGGGTVISLVCSHVIADARGLVGAVDAALTGHIPSPPPERTSDVADAARMVGTVLGRGAAATAALVFSARRRQEVRDFADATPKPRPETAHAPTSTCNAILDIDVPAWDSVAAEHEGTPNGLFIAVVTEIADAAGVPMPLHISVPVDARTSDSVHNAMVIAEVVAKPDDSLSEIRDASRAAFSRRPMGAPAGFPEEISQLLPDRLAHHLTAGAGERDALCSNIGRLPDSLARLGPYRTTGVATRAMHPRLTTDRAAGTTTRLSAYLCSNGHTYTLSLVGIDPTYFTDPGRLREIAVAGLARWGLSPRLW